MAIYQVKLGQLILSPVLHLFEKRTWPGHWLGSVLYVSFRGVTLLIGNRRTFRLQVKKICATFCFWMCGGRTHTNVYWLFSRTTWVGRYQKDKPFWILLKQEWQWWQGWQWHQLNHMQIICTSLQTDNHASTSLLHIFYRPDALPATQPTASKHWRQVWRKKLRGNGWPIFAWKTAVKWW